MLKTARNLFLIFILVAFLGFSLLVASYTIPTDNAYASFSQDDILSEGLYPSAIPNYNSTRLDMYTDSKILSEVAYYNGSRSLIYNSMHVFGTKGKDFNKFIEGDHNAVQSHVHYWCGNLVILKPLFYLIDYSSFRLLELFFELVMVIAIVKRMFDNNIERFAVPFLLALFLIHPEVVSLNIQYSTMMNIMLISVYLLLRFKEALFKNNRLFYYFLVIGMATSYFDLLTYPLVSFGIPMVFYFLLEDDSSNLKENIKRILLFGIVWSLGYLGMWASKWLISSILLNEDVFMMAFEKLLFRSSASDFTRVDAILRNLSVYKHKSYLIVFSLIVAYYAKRTFDLREKINLKGVKEVLPLLIIAALPFAWYLFASNHSYIHFWFTYRELLIFFFVIFCSLESVLIKKDLG